jgi:hypothetical protein
MDRVDQRRKSRSAQLVAQPAMPPRAASAACAAFWRKLSPSVAWWW